MKKLLKAQTAIKHFADTRRHEVSYQTGDWVLLKLRPHRQLSAKGPQEMQGKLAKRFYGPFRVVKRIGPVAYRLQLLDNARIHPVVHCSVLKPFRGSLELDEAIQLSSNFFQDQPVISPLAILDHHKSSPTGPWEVLMQ